MEELLAKYFEGQCTSEENQSILQWKEENPVLFNQYKDIWELSSTFSYPTNENSFYLIQHKIESQPKKVSFFSNKTLWRSAAAILLVCVIGLTFYSQNSPKVQENLYSTVITAEKPLQKVTLEDGTSIWLKQGAQVKIADTYNKNKREVLLTGNAYFDVAKNQEKPFIIHSNEVDIKVLGTSFSVINDASNLTVAVKSGKVDVRSSSTQNILTENQSVVYNKQTKKTTTAPISDKNTWAWTDKVITFENTELKEVISKIEAIYNVEITYNTSYEQLPFTGKFDNASMEEIIAVLEESLNLTLEFKYKP